ncbi:PDZ domain-containing protein [Ameyamaea chiangmaiensis]|nr:S41 family peptidase [Ameyamaea chiangmaiensis]MBS4075135.1 PDZ domain-containing protein [Ameyamaea chiangmaiensis]
MVASLLASPVAWRPHAARAQTPATGGASAGGFDATEFSAVIATALTFLGPRTLEAHPASDFALWGLNGLGALDPALSVVAPAPTGRAVPTVVLQNGQTALVSLPRPAPDDTNGWAALVTRFAEEAWQASATLRSGGGDGLTQSFFDELFNHLDPYSRYVAPTPATADRAARDGGAADVGLTLARDGERVVIAGVNTNGPAWPAGLNTGQIVVAVNGHAVEGDSAARVQALLQGAPDSRVQVTVAARTRTGGPGARSTVVLRRASVPPETVYAFSSGSVVILRITSFSADTAQEMSQYLDQATQDQKLTGLIFDLRGNRGGVLQQAVTTAALVMDNGVTAITRGRYPTANRVWAVQGGDMTRGVPIVILVDGRTASAAEILAAALSDHRRAVVVGSATLGKGLVQTFAQMPDGGELFVTWSRVLAPLGWPLQGLGVMPQVCTSRGEAAVTDQLQSLADGQPVNRDAVAAARAARFPLPVSRILDIRKACPAAVGTDGDLDVARTILDNPAEYKTLQGVIPDPSVLSGTAE